MRFGVAVIFLVAAFVASFTHIDSTEHVAFVDDDRRLRAEAPVNKAGASKLAGELGVKLKENPALTKTVNTIKKSGGNIVAIKNTVKQFAGKLAKDGAKISDESVTKISKTISEVLQKHPRAKKNAKITYIIATGLLSKYGLYKLLFDRDSDKNSTAPANTTTATSTTTTASNVTLK
ncbi:hypothetical protein L917_15887 [Phytophthora nicotianae]|uniref:RxLR effector protein n=2 Tax=Phytophthora nicotianae TaxID=4792 RepID=W2KGS9_PHYNI|nr:hypothetical protein L917_15887 [Phytophthora nicotianae]ETO66084.1 hypothetical protein F444_16670 [Phytophthora nicotianae P1976]